MGLSNSSSPPARFLFDRPTNQPVKLRTARALAFASTRSRYRRRRARKLLYLQNPSDTPPVSVAVTLRLFWYILLMPRVTVVLYIECQYPVNGTLSSANGIEALLDKHRIAETEEPVLLSHGLLVCVDDLIARGEGRNEHHERGARHMEVRDERVHHVEG